MTNPLNRLSILLGAAGVAALAVLGLSLRPPVARAADGKAAIGAWGVDLTAMDRSIAPGDDFFRHTGGTWMKNTQIPPDRSRWGSFNILAAKSETDVRAVLEDAAKAPLTPGSAERKAVDYFRSYIDTTAIDAKGLEPAKDDLARIAAARTHEDVIELAQAAHFRANLPIGLGVTLDAKRPDVYIVAVVQSGLGMPDRDYYLKDDAKFADIRAKYRDYVETMLKLGGLRRRRLLAPMRSSRSRRQIAQLHWPREKSRDRDLTYNPKSRRELMAFAPEFPWEAGLQSFGAPAQDFFIVAQLDAVRGLAKLFRDTPVATWRAYLTFHYLNTMADVLPKEFDAAAFDFHGRTVTGQPQQRDRWKRAVSAMSGTSLQRGDGRGSGPALCPPPLLAGVESRDAPAGRKPACCVP